NRDSRGGLRVEFRCTQIVVISINELSRGEWRTSISFTGNPSTPRVFRIRPRLRSRHRFHSGRCRPPLDDWFTIPATIKTYSRGPSPVETGINHTGEKDRAVEMLRTRYELVMKTAPCLSKMPQPDR